MCFLLVCISCQNVDCMKKIQKQPIQVISSVYLLGILLKMMLWGDLWKFSSKGLVIELLQKVIVLKICGVMYCKTNLSYPLTG